MENQTVSNKSKCQKHKECKCENNWIWIGRLENPELSRLFEIIFEYYQFNIV